MPTSETTFYVIGGTLQSEAACYIERQADKDLLSGLQDGKFCYVLTSRQMGKSSLMVRTAKELKHNGYAVVVLDLTAVGQNLTPEQWYDGLLNYTGQQLNLEDEIEDCWFDNKRLSPLQRWLKVIHDVVLKEISKKIVIFVDEIDTVRSLPFSTDEFFAAIRELYNERTQNPELERLTFCLLGVATPSDLIRDVRTTPFNIGQRIELKDFTEKEAASLAQGLKREKALATTLLNRIIYWTAGQPYLTQRLCQFVAEDNKINSPEAIDQLCDELFFSNRAKEKDDNLLFVQERILRTNTDLAGLLELYKQIYKSKKVQDDETNLLISILRLSGIVRFENGYLKVRNRIYEKVFDLRWILINMPNAELERQLKAKRKGQLQVGIAASIIILIMGLLVFVANNERIRAQQEEANKRRLLYTSQLALAYQAWDKDQIEKVRNMLDSQLPQSGQEDLRSFEWYYLNRLAHMELETLQGTDINTSVIFSPDGKMLASTTNEGSAILWDIKTKEKITTLKEFNSDIILSSFDPSSVAFSPNGKFLAIPNSISPENLINLWDVNTKQELASFKGHSKSALTITFSPDGKTLASGSADSTVRLWDVNTRQQLASLQGHEGFVRSVAFSPDGKTLASASADKTIKLWNLTTNQELATLKGHQDTVFSIIFSPDGKMLVSGSADGTVKLWDVATSQEIITLKGHKKGVFSTVFSPDGKMLASGSADGTVKLWSIVTKEELVTLKGHSGYIYSIAFSPDGKTLASASSDKTLKLWSTEIIPEPTILKDCLLPTIKISFSPDSKNLALGVADSRVKLWDLTSGKELSNFIGHSDGISSILISPSGKFLITGSWDETIKVRDLATQKELFSLKGHNGGITCMAISPDGKTLVSGSIDNTVKLWDLEERKEIVTFTNHTDTIRVVAFSPDGKKLVTGGDDTAIRIWDVAKKQELVNLGKQNQKIGSLVFSPDNTALAALISDIRLQQSQVKIWDLGTLKEVFSTTESDISCVAFSHNSARFIIGKSDGVIKLWDKAIFQEIAAFKILSVPIRELIFSPDGKTLAIVGDWFVKLLNMVPSNKIVTFDSACSDTANSPIASLTDFEQGLVGECPMGWGLGGKYSRKSGYTFKLTNEYAKSGKQSALLSRDQSKKLIPTGEGHVGRYFAVTPYLGKKVRLKVAIKAENPNAKVQISVMASTNAFRSPGYLSIADNQWHYYEITGDISRDENYIRVGVLLTGEGKIWIDDLSLEVVGDAKEVNRN